MKDAPAKKFRIRSVIFWYSITSAAALLVLLVLVSALFMYSATQNAYLSESVSSLKDNVDKLSSVDASAVYKDAIFLVKETETGKIGIFSFSDGSLVEELEVYTYSLPPTDRSYLESGILIYSVSELVSLIEDYTG